jgi:hypothetical protein
MKFMVRYAKRFGLQYHVCPRTGDADPAHLLIIIIINLNGSRTYLYLQRLRHCGRVGVCGHIAQEGAENDLPE